MCRPKPPKIETTAPPPPPAPPSNVAAATALQSQAQLADQPLRDPMSLRIQRKPTPSRGGKGVSLQIPR